MNSKDFVTYVDAELAPRERFELDALDGHVAVELVPAFVPLDGVQISALQVVETSQRHVRAAERFARHRHLADGQRAAGC